MAFVLEATLMATVVAAAVVGVAFVLLGGWF
jgi:hypothetical protein